MALLINHHCILFSTIWLKLKKKLIDSRYQDVNQLIAPPDVWGYALVGGAVLDGGAPGVLGGGAP